VEDQADKARMAEAEVKGIKEREDTKEKEEGV